MRLGPRIGQKHLDIEAGTQHKVDRRQFTDTLRWDGATICGSLDNFSISSGPCGDIASTYFLLAYQPEARNIYHGLDGFHCNNEAARFRYSKVIRQSCTIAFGFILMIRR